MDQLTARDIMRKDVVTIGADASVRELAELLSQHKVSGVPVLDPEGRVVGVATEGDVIYQDAELHFPHYVQFLDSVIYVDSIRRFEERFRKAYGTKVADIMSDEVISVEPDTSIRDIATEMIERDINRVPVVEDGKLVGIITRGDVVKAMARERGE